MLTSNEPLKNFASASLVAETEHLEVPNIYPIKPTLDLEKVHKKPQCYRKYYVQVLNELLTFQLAIQDFPP